jgi:antitoxin MazE
MKLSLVNIGKAKAIIISDSILEKYQFSENVELILENDHIILKPIVYSRQGWDVFFAEMHKNGDDKLLIDSYFEDDKL